MHARQDDNSSMTTNDNNKPLQVMATSATTDNNNGEPGPSAETLDDEWEEWDGKSPFWHHCVAGSLAGVAEHTLVYPLDTVRTHIQVCASCNFNGQNSMSPLTKAVTASSSGSTTSVLQNAAAARGALSANIPSSAGGGALPSSASSIPNTATSVHNMSILQALRQLVAPQPISIAHDGTAAVTDAAAVSATTTTTESIVNSSSLPSGGITRLWRGVQTILIGCIPAHALYFSTYEMIKAATLDDNGNVTTYGSALAGAAAVVSHDLVLGPLDTVKQRLQLGHYNGLSHALRMMIRNEGAISLFRSFPVTLATNIPYGVVMVGTNEFLKQQWTNNGTEKLTLPIMLGASSMAGLLASATTTPLDRIKTSLQTQQLTPACLLSPVSGQAPEVCPLTGQNNTHNIGGGGSGGPKISSSSSSSSTTVHKPLVSGWRQAAIRIYQTEGPVGFFRGLTPRVLSHTPAVAISWTTYETAKKYLAQHFGTD